MFLARVTGNVVATAKDKTLNGQKLFVVEPLNVKYDEATNQPASLGTTGRAIVALDVVGAVRDEDVLFSKVRKLAVGSGQAIKLLPCPLPTAHCPLIHESGTCPRCR